LDLVEKNWLLLPNLKYIIKVLAIGLSRLPLPLVLLHTRWYLPFLKKRFLASPEILVLDGFFGFLNFRGGNLGMLWLENPAAG